MKTKKPLTICLAYFILCLLCLFVISGCKDAAVSIPPPEPAVPKPDEMYVVTKDYVARVREDSPWFNSFWEVADKTCKADSGTRDLSWQNSTRCEQKLTRPPVAGLEKTFQPGQVVFKGTKTARGQRDLTSVALVLWYKDLARLFMENDPLPQAKPEAFKQEMASSGYPIEETAGGAIYWVRMIVIRPGTGANGGGFSYTLLVENSQLPQDPPGLGAQPAQNGSHFLGWKIRPVDTNEYNPVKDFKRYLPRFEKKEVYKGRSFWLGSCKAGG